MLNQYLTALTKAIKKSKKVKTHSQLKSEKWTKSCYDLLSRIIAEDLSSNMTEIQQLNIGTTISAKTLQKIITGEYRLAHPIDPRTVNTLTKLAIFKGAKSWDDFVNKEDQKLVKASKKNPKTEVTIAVHKALEAVFSCYTNLPELNEEKLMNHFVPNQSGFKKVAEIATRQLTRNTIVSNAYNPSTFEILDIEVKKITEDYAQVATKEYWLLCWWNTETERYVQRFKNIDKHLYILNKIEGVWKIKTDVSTCDVIEITKKKNKKKSNKRVAAAI